MSLYVIPWNRVAEEWDEITIVPYCWSKRLTIWCYYGWDCASGCV